MLARVFSVLFLVFCSVSGFAHELEMHDTLINKILANDCDCVVGCVNDKIYVHPNKLAVTEYGLFLNINEEYVEIPALYSDAQGVYIQKIFRRSITSPCPLCGWERISGAFKCSNPNCPSNQPKPEGESKKKK